MGAGKAIKKILIDKHRTITSLAEDMDKPRQTVVNVLYQDRLSIASALAYAEALNCTLCFIDNETGHKYEIYND